MRNKLASKGACTGTKIDHVIGSFDRVFVVLERGSGSLIEAALEAGFGSYGQFHRVYKRIFGTCPGERHGSPSLRTLRARLDARES